MIFLLPRSQASDWAVLSSLWLADRFFWLGYWSQHVVAVVGGNIILLEGPVGSDKDTLALQSRHDYNKAYNQNYTS